MQLSMLPRSAGGVVESDLPVYVTEGDHVISLIFTPSHFTAHLQGESVYIHRLGQS